MPWCLGASQSVRATSIPRSAWWALVFHTFCPLTTHSSPSSTAVVVSPARSDPAVGSLNSWHHTSSPVSIGRRNRSRVTSGPCSRIVGPARPDGTDDTAPHLAISSYTTSSVHAGSARPNHWVGHDGTAQPASSSRSRQARNDSAGSQLSCTQARTSARSDSSVRLIGSSCCHPAGEDDASTLAAVMDLRQLRDDDGECAALHDLGGDGPPLLLTHGNGLNAGMWATVVPHLQGTFHCFGLDFRGHGASRQVHDRIPVERRWFVAEVLAAWVFEPVLVPATWDVKPPPSGLIEASRRRRIVFGSVEEAVARFRSKPPFADC